MPKEEKKPSEGPNITRTPLNTSKGSIVSLPPQTPQHCTSTSLPQHPPLLMKQWMEKELLDHLHVISMFDNLQAKTSKKKPRVDWKSRNPKGHDLGVPSPSKKRCNKTAYPKKTVFLKACQEY